LSHSVFKTMSETEAELERFAWLGDELALAIWRRDTPVAETSYNQPGHHTLSYYLDGGHGTERMTMPGVYGAPKRLCTLPDWHESSWTVRGQMHFLHIYFLPQHFTRRAVVELDREPRELTLADRTYFEHERIGHLCAALAEMPWDGPDAQLRANEVTHETLSHLLLAQSAPLQQRACAAAWRRGAPPAGRLHRSASGQDITWACWRNWHACPNTTWCACSKFHSACRHRHGSPRAASNARACC
jgi:AraC family transcriptional regulator